MLSRFVALVLVFPALVCAQCPYMSKAPIGKGMQLLKTLIYLRLTLVFQQGGVPIQNPHYAEALAQIDWTAVKKDIQAMFKNSQDFWPADYGTYAPFMVRQVCDFVLSCFALNLMLGYRRGTALAATATAMDVAAAMVLASGLTPKGLFRYDV